MGFVFLQVEIPSSKYKQIIKIITRGRNETLCFENSVVMRRAEHLRLRNELSGWAELLCYGLLLSEINAVL